MCAVAEGLPAILRDLHRYALSLTREPDAAADLVQDTCARALEKAHLFEAGSNLRAWCASIMHNGHVGSCRIWRRRMLHLQMIADSATQEIDGGQEARVLLRQVLDAAERTPSFYDREVAMDVAGDTIREIAARTRLPEGTIKSRLSRSRKALREAVQWEAA